MKSKKTGEFKKRGGRGGKSSACAPHGRKKKNGIKFLLKCGFH